MIPANTPLVFELEVLECQPSIEEINEVNEKANNNAPIVYRRGKRPAPVAQPSSEKKKEVTEIKHTVTKMKKTVGKQKKKLNQDVLQAKDIENDISASESKD